MLASAVIASHTRATLSPSPAAPSPKSASSSPATAGRALLLAIDTSIEGDIALAELDATGELKLLGSQRFSGRHQATELMPKLRNLLETAGVTLPALRAIVVVSGPGTFTGLRIGISAAKGLSEAGGIPLIAISSLAALSHQAAPGTVAVLQAGRAEYYVRSDPQTDGGGVEARETSETLETEDGVAALTKGKAVLVSDAKLADRFPAALSVTVEGCGAWQALVAALPRLVAEDFDDAATLDANYVRRPYTEMAKPVL